MPKLFARIVTFLLVLCLLAEAVPSAEFPVSIKTPTRASELVARNYWLTSQALAPLFLTASPFRMLTHPANWVPSWLSQFHDLLGSRQGSFLLGSPDSVAELFLDSLNEKSAAEFVRVLQASDGTDWVLNGQNYMVVNNLLHQRHLIDHATPSKEGLRQLLLSLKPQSTMHALVAGLPFLRATPPQVRARAIAKLSNAEPGEIAQYLAGGQEAASKSPESILSMAHNVYSFLHVDYPDHARPISDLYELPLVEKYVIRRLARTLYPEVSDSSADSAAAELSLGVQEPEPFGRKRRKKPSVLRLRHHLKRLAPALMASRSVLYSYLHALVAHPDTVLGPVYPPEHFELTQAAVPDAQNVAEVYRSLSIRWQKARLTPIHGSIDFHMAVISLLSNDPEELRLLTDWATASGSLPFELYRVLLTIDRLRDQAPRHDLIDHELLSRMVNRLVHLRAWHHKTPWSMMDVPVIERHPNEVFKPLNIGQLMFWAALAGINPKLWIMQDKPILGLFPWENSPFGERVKYATQDAWASFLSEAEEYHASRLRLLRPWQWFLEQNKFYAALLASPERSLNAVDHIISDADGSVQADLRGRFEEPLLRTLEAFPGRQRLPIDHTLFKEYIQGLRKRAA